MGIDLPPSWPDPDCRVCILYLPDVMSARINGTLWGDFSGSVFRTPGVPNEFSGLLTGASFDTPFFASFCDGISNDLYMRSAGVVLSFCGGGVAYNNHCRIPVSAVSWGGCEYRLG